MADDEFDRDEDSPHKGKGRSLFDDVVHAIGRTAGRTKDALVRLGERGAVALAIRRIERERSGRLEELGALARKALAESEGTLKSQDAGVAEILAALDRLDEKLARLRERLEQLGGKAASDAGPPDEAASGTGSPDEPASDEHPPDEGASDGGPPG